MKKYKIYIITIIILMIIPIVIKQLKTEHHIEYKINNYSIEEKFYIRNKEHYYEIIIKKNNKKYTYIINKNIHKNSKIIKQIKTYNNKNIDCIIPIYKNIKQNNIYCLKDNKQVSNYSLIENNEYLEIISKVKKYNISEIKTTTTSTKENNMNIYQKNIPSNIKLIIWDYKGIYIINQEKIMYKKILDYDLYDNIMSTIVNDYYVLFENTKVSGIENIYYYNLKSNKLKTLKLDTKISKNSYINGVEDNLIYITDLKEKKQYTLDLKGKLKEIGNEELSYIIYNNHKKEIVGKKDFLKEKIFFNNEQMHDQEEIQEYNIKYTTKDNDVYKYIGENEIYLFTKEFNEYNVVGDNIILRDNDTLYLYNDDIGLNKIIEYNELNYNSKNTYRIWEE